MLTGKSTLQIRSIIIEWPVLIFVHFVTKVILNRDANLFYGLVWPESKNLVNFKKSEKTPFQIFLQKAAFFNWIIGRLMITLVHLRRHF